MVRADRDTPERVFERWRLARRAALVVLREADPDTRIPWATNPLPPTTLATTRLAEHWAHGLDITDPLGIAFPDTARLRHVAWLAHRTLPYAFALTGAEPSEVRCELTGPEGEPMGARTAGRDIPDKRAGRRFLPGRSASPVTRGIASAGQRAAWGRGAQRLAQLRRLSGAAHPARSAAPGPSCVRRSASNARTASPAYCPLRVVRFG